MFYASTFQNSPTFKWKELRESRLNADPKKKKTKKQFWNFFIKISLND